MNYRQIPRCNFNVSEIGLGCEHLEKKDKNLVEEVIGTALDGGINIMDVFMPQPEVRTHIGNAIRHARQKIYLQGHIGATLGAHSEEVLTELGYGPDQIVALRKSGVIG